MLAEKSFGCRTNAKALCKLFFTTMSNPSNLGRKSCNVVFFLLEKRFGNEHRHIYVLVSKLLEARVKNFLNVFPYCISVRADNHAALYAGIINKIGLFNDVCIPFSKILFHRGDFGNQLFIILCHNMCPFKIA